MKNNLFSLSRLCLIILSQNIHDGKFILVDPSASLSWSILWKDKTTQQMPDAKIFPSFKLSFCSFLFIAFINKLLWNQFYDKTANSKTFHFIFVFTKQKLFSFFLHDDGKVLLDNKTKQKKNDVKTMTWLLFKVCREFIRGACKRAESECRFAHPKDGVTQLDDGSVTVCMDAVRQKGCSRSPCRYFHPPLHLQAQIKAAQSRAVIAIFTRKTKINSLNLFRFLSFMTFFTLSLTLDNVSFE